MTNKKEKELDKLQEYSQTNEETFENNNKDNQNKDGSISKNDSSEEVKEELKLSAADKETKRKIMEVSTFLEKIEAKTQASSELRKLTNDRITHLSEKIGEIKELFNVVSSEKKDIEVKVSQHSEILKRIDPKLIFSKIDESNIKISTLKEKLLKFNSKENELKERLKKFQNKLKVLDGEEEILKFQNDLKQEFKTISRLSSEASSHVNSIENKFINFNKKVNKATTLFKDMTGLKNRMNFLCEQVQTELDHFNTNADSSVFEMVDELAGLVSTGFDKFEMRLERVEHQTKDLKENKKASKFNKFKNQIKLKFESKDIIKKKESSEDKSKTKQKSKNNKLLEKITSVKNKFLRKK